MIPFPPDILVRIKTALLRRGVTEALVKIEKGEIHVFAVSKSEIK